MYLTCYLYDSVFWYSHLAQLRLSNCCTIWLQKQWKHWETCQCISNHWCFSQEKPWTNFVSQTLEFASMSPIPVAIGDEHATKWLCSAGKSVSKAVTAVRDENTHRTSKTFWSRIKWTDMLHAISSVSLWCLGDWLYTLYKNSIN